MTALAQLVRAGGAGGAATGAHYAVMAVLLALGWDPVAATAAGSAFGALVSYLLSRRFVFQTTEGHSRALPKFLVTAAVGFGLNAALVWVGVHALSAPVWLVQVGATLVVFLFNFAVNKVWTFRDRTGAQ